MSLKKVYTYDNDILWDVFHCGLRIGNVRKVTKSLREAKLVPDGAQLGKWVYEGQNLYGVTNSRKEAIQILMDAWKKNIPICHTCNEKMVRCGITDFICNNCGMSSSCGV